MARLDRSCWAELDCAVLNHQVDCCGSEVVLGLAAKGRAAAQLAEDACVAKGPFCRCAAREPVAEDGKTIPSGAALKVRCVAGRCVSFVP